MDNNVIFRAQLRNQVPPDIELQFGPQGQNFTLNGQQINQIHPQNPFIWNGNGGGNVDERVIISFLDRTITQGNNAQLNHSIGVHTAFVVKTTNAANTYCVEYNNTTHYFKVSTITLRTPFQNDPAGMMRVRIEARKV